MNKVLATLTAALLTAVLSAAGAQAFTKDSLVWEKCTGCHEPEGGKIPRVEELRTTPEEWAVIVDRMHRLYDMDLAAGEMDQLLKELCTTQILTPAEMAKVAYLSLQHNSQQMEVPSSPEEEELIVTCVRCHSAGKIYSYRMTPDHWAKVKDFHLYTTPTVTMQMREMRWLPRADGVLAYLGREYGYGKAWQAPNEKVEGTYLVVGREPGKGEYRGEAQLTSKGNSEFAVSGTLRYSDGSSENFGGEATLYGGYALRTRTSHNGFRTRGAYIFSDGELRGENHFPAPDFRTSTSRWIRKGSDSRVLRVVPAYLVHGQEVTLRIDGLNLPKVKTADVRFSNPSVEVISARQVSPELIEARVVYRGFDEGETVLSVEKADSRSLMSERLGVTEDYAGGAVDQFVPGKIRLARKIERIAVTPATGRARLSGGPNYPAEGVQFEAIAYSSGPSISDHSDDVPLGPVSARFHLEEEVTRPQDDDVRWIGGIGPDGTYLPIGDYNPVRSRKYSGEASGWVKVIAKYAAGSEELTGEANLAVTVPDFIPRIR